MLRDTWKTGTHRAHPQPLTGSTNTMSLTMKEECERCKAVLTPDGAAFICSFECTFCPACAEAMERRCPNCGGELVPRPHADLSRL